MVIETMTYGEQIVALFLGLSALGAGVYSRVAGWVLLCATMGWYVYSTLVIL